MDRIEFLKARQNSIGGSDIAAILGLSKYKSPLDVFNEKTGRTEITDEMNEPCYWGTVMETVLVSEFEKRMGFKVNTDNPQVFHHDNKFMAANIDGIFDTGDPEMGMAILECKTASSFMANEWGEEGTNQVPVGYKLQCQHYLSVYDLKLAFVAVLIGGNDFRVYVVHREDELIEKMNAAISEFWNEFVLKDIEPPEGIQDQEAHVEMIAAIKGSSVVVDDVSILNNIDLIKSLKAEKKEIEAKLKDATGFVQEAMGENENFLDVNGDPLCTWKESKRRAVDAKLLEKELPDTYKKYLKESVSRRFLTK
jgi:putative phage-type endonuclease